mmetsp:Transcript_87698/g.225986  ORF Transcript_87698/g.225986 Transcript_87698/m.225986 type:complete len:316 (-) Transcript_87698:1278-2225(-)
MVPRPRDPAGQKEARHRHGHVERGLRDRRDDSRFRALQGRLGHRHPRKGLREAGHAKRGELAGPDGPPSLAGHHLARRSPAELGEHHGHEGPAGAAWHRPSHPPPVVQSGNAAVSQPYPAASVLRTAARQPARACQGLSVVTRRQRGEAPCPPRRERGVAARPGQEQARQPGQRARRLQRRAPRTAPEPGRGRGLRRRGPDFCGDPDEDLRHEGVLCGRPGRWARRDLGRRCQWRRQPGRAGGASGRRASHVLHLVGIRSAAGQRPCGDLGRLCLWRPELSRAGAAPARRGAPQLHKQGLCSGTCRRPRGDLGAR